MKSLLFQGVTPFIEPPECGTNPCRTEVPLTIRRNGRLYKFVLRDRVVPEDPYLTMVKAKAFSIQQGEPYRMQLVARGPRDLLIKDNVVI